MFSTSSQSTQVGDFPIEPSGCLGFSLRDGASSGKLCMGHHEDRLRIYVGPTSRFLQHERDELIDHVAFLGVANAVNDAEVTLMGLRTILHIKSQGQQFYLKGSSTHTARF